MNILPLPLAVRPLPKPLPLPGKPVPPLPLPMPLTPVNADLAERIRMREDARLRASALEKQIHALRSQWEIVNEEFLGHVRAVNRMEGK